MGSQITVSIGYWNQIYPDYSFIPNVCLSWYTYCFHSVIGIIDAHGLKIQGRGYLMFFAKIPKGVKAFRKNCLGGGSPYFGFYCIFINKCFEIRLRVVLYLPSPLPPSPPPCVYLWLGSVMVWAKVIPLSMHCTIKLVYKDHTRDKIQNCK